MKEKEKEKEKADRRSTPKCMSGKEPSQHFCVSIHRFIKFRFQILHSDELATIKFCPQKFGALTFHGNKMNRSTFVKVY